ncbi:hypothetical protein GCM10025864_44970 [Luteimicrobium album]|uniref:Uncharacterized protein n=1 Tax=Luteimicrobium album TaxID=1054550 RepID=A0ABQ6I9V7_9MICO|nr:hypothetical protein GCM10025864_44350 [Luteimicrobium album]GMA26738.1 hypothetical protein GCM10025864_44970 [Luteimicrobium album]
MIAVDELYTTARTLTAAPHGLLRRVNALIPHASNTVAESQLGGRADIHRIPWNGPAANLALDIAAAVRRHESTLTLLLFQQARFRPDGDRQTLDAIGRLPVLVDHAIASGHGGRPRSATPPTTSPPGRVAAARSSTKPTTTSSPGRPHPRRSRRALTAIGACTSRPDGSTPATPPMSCAAPAATTTDSPCDGTRGRGSPCSRTGARPPRREVGGGRYAPAHAGHHHDVGRALVHRIVRRARHRRRVQRRRTRSLVGHAR